MRWTQWPEVVAPSVVGVKLYNAFAGESEEEMFSDDNDEPYRDRLANIPEKEGDEDSHLLSEKR